VSFGLWVKYHILDIVDRYFAVARDERRTESLTRADDEADEEVQITAEEFRIADLRREEYAVFMTDALNTLNDKERKAYLMRHMWGWEIENNDPAVPTISGHFGVTPRTINNWLNSADGKLAKWRNQRGS
jgi:DNA-directed RNA polymerase specialized sigma24 family protein